MSPIYSVAKTTNPAKHQQLPLWIDMAMTDYGACSRWGPYYVIPHISRVIYLYNIYNHSYPFQKPFIGVIPPVTTGSSPPCCTYLWPTHTSFTKKTTCDHDETHEALPLNHFPSLLAKHHFPRCTTFQHLALVRGGTMGFDNSGWVRCDIYIYIYIYIPSFN